MSTVFLLIVCFAFGVVNAQDCSASYRRFSSHHTMCLPRNNTCNIVARGVTDDEKSLLLDIHNNYRSKVANGNEKKAGGLPTASDMMQMEWDDQLAAIAQKWAENCVYKHDCDECRDVENFSVGQNIAFFETTCLGQTCLVKAKDWKSTMQAFYDEVNDFPRKFLSAFQHVGSKPYGHFTQIIWSKTWKLGCGYVFFKYGFTHRHFYVCNYGPGGNILNTPVYTEGKPCTGCPINSCCDKACKGKLESYPGLCKMLYTDRAPIYAHPKDLLFFCDFTNGDPDCKRETDGMHKWHRTLALQGTYISSVLKGGESTTIRFAKMIVPTTSSFCLKVVFRKGPLITGPPDTSKLKLGLAIQSYLPVDMLLKLTSNRFSTFSGNLSWGSPTRFSLTFSVPRDSPDHILDIQEISASNGPCNKR